MQRHPFVRALAGAAFLLLTAAFPPAAAQSGAESGAESGTPDVQALKRRIEALKAALAGDVCRDPAAAARLLSISGPPSSGPPSSGRTMAGPPAVPAALPSAAPLPPTPPPSPPPEAAGAEPGQPLTRAGLVKLLQDAVVLVIADQSTGSGFFVAPDLVVTNDHVLDKPDIREVVVIGHGTGGPRTARVLARVAGAGFNSRDYALLKVDGGPAPAVLPLTTATGELTRVVAAGYPGLLLQNDMNFRALLRGDMRAMPDLGLAQGAVMALQNRDRGMMTIVHSAPISSGNSGGPLVDLCGRVMGINTFVNSSAKQGTSAGFALASADLMAFLKSHGVEPSSRPGICQE